MKSRSPWAGATKTELRLHRTCATMVANWERAARRGDFFPMDHWSPIPNSPGGLRPVFILRAFLERAWERLILLPDVEKFLELDRLDHLRRSNPAAYETAMLRRELAAHREVCLVAGTNPSSILPAL